MYSLRRGTRTTTMASKRNTQWQTVAVSQEEQGTGTASAEAGEEEEKCFAGNRVFVSQGR